MSGGDRGFVTHERTWDATIEDVWAMWTTKEGIASWWGPRGFVVAVDRLDLRPGGALEYTMTAEGPNEIAYMKSAGRPLTTRHHVTITEVVPLRRFAYEHLVDFIPDIEPYTTRHLVELSEVPGGVRMLLTYQRMHDDRWTKLASMGWESELGRLAEALAR